MQEKEYDFDKELEKIVGSERRRQCWGWVVLRSFEEPFYVRDMARSLRMADSVLAGHVKVLKGFGLLERLEPPEWIGHATPASSSRPLHKISSELWAPIEEKIAETDPDIFTQLKEIKF